MRRGFPIIVIIVLVAQGCTDLSQPGVELLTDPNIKPKVISTYPPMNSQGPYIDINVYRGNSYPIEIRFNKIMNRLSVLSNFSFKSSLNERYIIDNEHMQTYGGDLYYFNPFDSVSWDYFSYSNAKLEETFTIALSSDAKDINGNTLSFPFSMTLVPEPYFRIKDVHPPNGTLNFPANSVIILILNSPVNNKFLDYISINPILEGLWTIPINDSAQILYNYTILPANQSYTITVSEGAPDKYDHLLKTSFSSSFSTPNFFITDSYPNTRNALLSSTIRVTLSVSMDTSTLQQSFHITPNTEGTILLNEKAATIYFYPELELLPNAFYTITIDTTLKSSNGYDLSDTYTYSFNTPIFTVRSQYPNPYDTKFSNTSTIKIYFTALLDTSTIRSAFHINPEVTGYLDYAYYNDFIFFTPKDKFEAYTTYTITIDSTLRSIGGLYLPKPHMFSFATRY